jgi:predicted RNA binding protein YcfA (HicA-like mRNA interferase family)
MSLKPQSPIKVIKALSKIGFKIVRNQGSHVVLKHPDGRLTVVPVHAGEDIGTGLLNKIILHSSRRSAHVFLFLWEETLHNLHIHGNWQESAQYKTTTPLVPIAFAPERLRMEAQCFMFGHSAT